MLNKLTELQKALVAAALILLLGFGGGYYAKGKLDNRVTHDTTFVPVQLPAPPPIVVHDIPATVTPTVKEKLVFVEDTNKVTKLNIQIQTLLSDQDSLRHRLTILLAEHYGTFDFAQPLGEVGFIGGSVLMKYTPMEQTFGAAITFDKLALRQEVITNRVMQVWWQRPLLFVSGAATAYFIQQHNSTGALVSGGVGLVNIFWEF